jgi:HOOK domain
MCVCGGAHHQGKNRYYFDEYISRPLSHPTLFHASKTFFCFRAPGFFGTLASSRHLGDNWALQQADIKKLLRFMEIFFQMELHKSTEAIAKIDVAAIAKRQDAHETFAVLKLVAVAAVLCSRKTRYIERMMDRLSTNVQGTLKLVLEVTMASLVDVEETSTTQQTETTEPFESLTAADDSESASLFSADVNKPVVAATATVSDDVVPSPYRKNLRDVSQELELRIQQLEVALAERDQSLAERDQSLDDVMAENAVLRDKLQECTTQLEELTGENVRLVDEQDILLPQVRQLYRAQAETSVYKKHIVDMSYEKSQHMSGSGRELSLSIPVSDEDMDLFPCFDDSDDDDASTPFFLSELLGNDDHAVIPDDVDELATLDQLKCQMELLLESHRLKESENESLLRENEKLSAYVKRAVARYQDQYLTAKQDLSKSQKQIKEQQQLIGMLQRRIERQPSLTMTSTRRKKNKVQGIMKAKVQEYGLGAY